VSARDAYLVVGGDSLVGGGLLQALRRRGMRAFASTRRKDTLTAERVFLDFESDELPRIPPEVGYAFLVAAATNYDRCERDPLARSINVELIPRVVAALLEQGIFVTFISTNSVFGGERPWPSEDDSPAPGIAYARQKAEAEEAIRRAARTLGVQERLNIVRLTKILDRTTSPVPAWLGAWQRGEPVQPFRDLVFAPMSVQFVGDALAAIGERRIPGNLHLSGANNVSYVDFAEALARQFGVAAGLIAPTTAKEKGVSIAFMPRYSGLGMRRTTELSGLQPQTLASVVRDLAANPRA
jgi:dTDP-4-dehydrorhamnose reductase